MSGFIGVHAGAGVHSDALSLACKKLCKEACKKGADIVMSGGSAVDAVSAAVVILEDSPCTNAGIGSNLTWSGTVECDACVMDGHTLTWGGVGAIPGIRNPVTVAKQLCHRQSSHNLMMGRIPPCLLVGEGARQWAVEAQLPIVDPKVLVSAKAAKIHHHYKKKLSKVQGKAPFLLSPLDTVGAVCMDNQGHVAAACSSGGIILKHPGRVGQAAIFGCGCWAQDGQNGSSSVATCTSGCGEYLTRTMLAREVASDLQSTQLASTALHETFVKKFLGSPFLEAVPDAERLGGVIALKMTEDGLGEFLWAHTTESLCLGYMNCQDGRLKSHTSRLPHGVTPGTKVVVGGAGFTLNIPNSSTLSQNHSINF